MKHPKSVVHTFHIVKEEALKKYDNILLNQARNGHDITSIHYEI